MLLVLESLEKNSVKGERYTYIIKYAIFNMLNKLVDQYKSEMYFVFRVLVGYMFALHGAAKLGLLGGSTMTGLMLFVGIIELVVGIAVLLGAYVDCAAVIGAAVMLVAFVWKHFSLNPLDSGGEAALLYFAAFLVLAVYGPGKWTVGNSKKK